MKKTGRVGIFHRRKDSGRKRPPCRAGFAALSSNKRTAAPKPFCPRVEQLEDRRMLAITPFPVPLEAEDPLGCLIYDSSVTADIAVAGETDGFTIDLDAGQTLTAVVDPDVALAPTLELSGPSGPIALPAPSGTPGEDLVVQTVAVADAGTYTLTVGGAGNTTGAYTLGLILNAAVEDEQHDGAANDDAASAQDLDDTLVQPGSMETERGAVLGSIDGTGGLSESQTQRDNVYSPNVLDYHFAGATIPSRDGVLTVTATADLADTSEYLTLDAEGMFTRDLFVIDGLDRSSVETAISVPQAVLSTLAADGVISFTVTPSSSVIDLGSSKLIL